jgi:hypothetical protein
LSGFRVLITTPTAEQIVRIIDHPAPARPALLLFVLTIAPFAAGAQGFGRVANQPYGGGLTIINNMRIAPTTTDKVKITNSSISGALGSPAGGTKAPIVPPRIIAVNLLGTLQSAWSVARDSVTRDALNFLDERNIGGGFRTSRNRLTLAPDGPLFIGWDGLGFTLRYALHGNRLSTYLRTPTPLSADVDPGFIVDFDIDVIADINVKDNQLVAGPSRIQVNAKRPQGKNITGDLVVAVNDLLATIIGTDFAGSMLKKINGRDFSFQNELNRAIAPLNPLLVTAARGGVIRPGFDAASGNATLTLLNAGPAPVIH